MTDREKLTALVAQSLCDHLSLSCKLAENIAKDLIVNGVTIQKWIPVTERLPEDFVSVLVHIPDDSPLPTVKEAYHAGGLWITRCCMCNDADITHWMPLPQPPKEVAG